MNPNLPRGTKRPLSADGSATSFSLTTYGQNARYSLAGTAGQRVSVLISNATCCSNYGTLSLLKPDGSTLSSNNNLAATTFLDAVTLPVDGTYTVLVNPDADRLGSFTLRVYSVTDVTGTVAADGSATSFSLTTPGQNVRYSFAGTANQQVNLSLINSTIGGSTAAAPPTAHWRSSSRTGRRSGRVRCASRPPIWPPRPCPWMAPTPRWSTRPAPTPGRPA